MRLEQRKQTQIINFRVGTALLANRVLGGGEAAAQQQNRVAILM